MDARPIVLLRTPLTITGRKEALQQNDGGFDVPLLRAGASSMVMNANASALHKIFRNFLIHVHMRWLLRWPLFCYLEQDC